MMAIKFRLYCNLTRPGEVVKVTGSGPELGSWNPANSLTLHTSKEEFPIWRAGIFIDADRQPNPEILEYKYIIVHRHGQNYMDEQSPDATPRHSQPQPYWENFKGNRTISLQTHGELLIQDVFNEKKILKLEVHTDEMSNPFGKSSQRYLGQQSKDQSQRNELFNIIQTGLGPPEAGFESKSQDNYINQRPTQKQQDLERMVFQKYKKQQDKMIREELMKYVGREKQGQFGSPSKVAQMAGAYAMGQGGAPPAENLHGYQDQHSVSEIKFIQIDQQDKPKPHSDFMLNQEALNIVESDNRKFVKMVRVMRKTDEDQNNEMPHVRNNSQPYFLGDEVDSEIEHKVPSNVVQDYQPIYQLNDQNKLNAPNTMPQAPVVNPMANQSLPSLETKDNQSNSFVNFNPFQMQQNMQQQNNFNSLNQQLNHTAPNNLNTFFGQAGQDGKAPIMPNPANPMAPMEQQQFPENSQQPFPILNMASQPVLSNDVKPESLKDHAPYKIRDNHQDGDSSFFQANQNQQELLDYKKMMVIKPVPSMNSVSQDAQSGINNFDFSTEDEYEKKLLDNEIKISKHDSLVVMSFKLPVTVIKLKTGEFAIKESKSFLYPSIFKLREKDFINFQWIGWPGIIPDTQEEKERITLLLKEQRCYPIWLTRTEIEEFLLFHEQHLRTLFHGFKSASGEDIEELMTELWHNYCAVNRRYALNLLQIKKEREMVWIHDTYLLMAPYYLKKLDINANIGFSFHAPFPSSDIYRAFQYRSEILNSILHCDIIGFHLYDYARNFLFACKKIFQLSHQQMRGGFIALEYNGRTVLLNVQHIGINQDHVQDMLKSPLHNSFKEQVVASIQYKKVIISSVDRLHPLSGVLPKLQGYQHFLRQNKTNGRDVCLIQYVSTVDFIDFFSFKNNQVARNNSSSSLTNNKEDHVIHKKQKEQKVEEIKKLIQQTEQEINKVVHEIHEEFGDGCLIYKVQSLTQEERLALWSFSNVLLNTSLRDGLTFSPFEFIYTKYYKDKFGRASIVLSEFSGCARQLNGAYLVNPFDLYDISQNLSKVMLTNHDEKQERMEQMFGYVQRHSTIRWCQKFLIDLKRAYDPMNVSSYQKTGFGADQRIIKFKQGFKEFEFNMIEGRYKASGKRIIIIDQEGVIPMREIDGQPEPTSEVIKALDLISNIPQNIVFVISSESKMHMHKWYSKKAPKLGLAAENGFFWRWTSQNQSENDWNKLIEIDDFGWINQVRLLMMAYKNKTEGSFIEEKESSIIWNFKNTDFEFGQMQAKELRQQINDVFQNFPIEILETKFTIQVVPLELKKEKLVKTLIEKESAQYGEDQYRKKQLDFILYVGDDSQSEQVFKYLNRIQTKQQRLLKKQLIMQNNPQAASILEKLKMSTKMNISPDINVFTCTQGRKATQAKYFLSDTYQIVNVIEQIHEVQEKINSGSLDLDKKTKRHYSIANFNSNFKSSKLIDKIDNDVVKTRFGGDFSRQSGKNKNKFKFGQLTNNIRQQQNVAGINQDQIQGSTKQQTDSAKYQSGSSYKKSPMNRKRGIAQKLATKIGGSDSGSEDFGSAQGKSNNYAVGSEVNFGSDNDIQ